MFYLTKDAADAAKVFVLISKGLERLEAGICKMNESAVSWTLETRWTI
jgi:hypothetical protein